jgi:hypothetical protein
MRRNDEAKWESHLHHLLIVTVARQLNLYEPQFACLQNGGNIAYEKVEL